MKTSAEEEISVICRDCSILVGGVVAGLSVLWADETTHPHECDRPGAWDSPKYSVTWANRFRDLSPVVALVRGFRNLGFFFSNLWFFLPSLWRFRSWDWQYNYDLFMKSLASTEAYITRHQRHVDWEKDVESIQSVLMAWEGFKDAGGSEEIRWAQLHRHLERDARDWWD